MLKNLLLVFLSLAVVILIIVVVAYSQGLIAPSKQGTIKYPVYPDGTVIGASINGETSIYTMKNGKKVAGSYKDLLNDPQSICFLTQDALAAVPV